MATPTNEEGDLNMGGLRTLGFDDFLRRSEREKVLRAEESGERSNVSLFATLL